jgi:hypothetical protein
MAVAKKTEVKMDAKVAELLSLKSNKDRKDDRVPLFTIDDREYTVPAKPRMNITLKFMNEMRKSGNELYAAMQLLEDMLGTDNYQDLLNWDDLDDDVLGQIITQCIELATARTDGEKGK